MNRATLILGLTLLTAAATAAGADDLTRTIEAENGWVHLAFPAREGVHGHGRCVTIENGTVVISGDDHDGLIHVTMKLADGEVDDLHTRVGGAPGQHEREARDLGETTAAAAAAYLLDLAAELEDDEVAADAIGAAALADTETWPALVAIAHDRDRGQEVREASIFWLGIAAGEKVEQDLVAIIDDDRNAIEIREHAVFALHQAVEDDADRAIATLGRIATENFHPEVRRSALFWLAQYDDPAVVDLFEDILLR